MKFAIRATILVVLMHLLVPTTATLAQDATDGALQPVSLMARPLPADSAIRLDGRIDEDIWSSAVPITDFTQQEPVEGGVPSHPTEIRVMFDNDNLYIGAIIYDDPEGVLAFQRQRDAGLGTDDRFMWILDTFRDGRTGYFFEINAAGLMGDGIITGGGGGGGRGGGGGGGGGTNKAWDGIWEARTAMRPDGWSAEIRIPFRTLNFNPNLDTWGINFQRTIRRFNEEILWRGWRRSESLFSPVFAGRLEGLEGLSQGIGLEAIPSVVSGWRNTPGDTIPIGTGETTTYPQNLSLDVNYSVTSSLRASVSINTDFAEVESDQRQVNLTRFPQRFPEQRDFFLEGSGVFGFAPRSSADPFFSRRIGLRSGRPVPINYGGRLTGQIGRYEVGFYQIGTGSESFPVDDGSVLIPREDFTVARVKRGLFEQSSIGAIYTRRASAPDDSGIAPEDQHSAGVDVELATRNFLGDNNAELQLFAVWNSDPVSGADHSFGDLTARGFRLNFPNPVWNGHLSYREFGEAYDPAVGFVTRNNFRRVEPRIQYSLRPASIDWLRQMDFSVQFRNLTQLGTGLLEEREWQFQPLSFDFESGDGFNYQLTRTYEFLDRSFEVFGVPILAGGYTTWNSRIFGRTAGHRKVSLFGGYGRGGFWNGDQSGFSARLTFRPTPGVSVSGNFNHNKVTLPQGSFTADVYEIEGQWNPSPWVSTTTQFQYDNQSDIVGLFARLRWIVTPGSDMYLVYTHNWRNLGLGLLENPDLVTLSRGASVKLSYTYRF
ncbi:MAG: DUF5916 domain-containing protein [Gemmatimonadota bacterium]